MKLSGQEIEFPTYELKNTKKQIVITKPGKYVFMEDLTIYCENEDFKASIVVNGDNITIDFNNYILFGSHIGIFVRFSNNIKIDNLRGFAGRFVVCARFCSNITIRYVKGMVRKYSRIKSITECKLKDRQIINYAVGYISLPDGEQAVSEEIIKKICYLINILEKRELQDLFFLIGVHFSYISAKIITYGKFPRFDRNWGDTSIISYDEL